jgi:hypothetical protein
MYAVPITLDCIVDYHVFFAGSCFRYQFAIVVLIVFLYQFSGIICVHKLGGAVYAG